MAFAESVAFLLFAIVAIEANKNILLLLADDGGFEMGAYLNKYCQTPNLDALAKRGLLFNNAFSSVSSCSSSRVQLLTGLPSHSNGMYGLHEGVHNFNVLPAVKSLPNILREKSQGKILSGIIGVKNVGAVESFLFDYEQTEEQHSKNEIGRNITNIKLYSREFLLQAKRENRPFFLLIGFHDPHRCGHVTPQYGEFCERWGSGEVGMGLIPDWKPIYYDWRNLKVPSYLPDTDIVRQELAAQYMTISRLDQGVGVVLRELEAQGFEKDTLVIYTSDNGPPFPGGRSNLYDRGIHEPFIMASQEPKDRRHEVTSAMTSLLDIYPTVLDFFNIKIDTNATKRSLLPLLRAEPQPKEQDHVFASHNFHEITMNYPMRMIRTRHFKLLHNLNFWSPFPIDQEVYISPTFQQILNLTITKQPLPWYRTLLSYYQRPEWELYDIKLDPMETRNLVGKDKYAKILQALQDLLYQWQVDTKDPWRCAPHAVLQSEGIYKDQPVCLTLGHESMEQITLAQYGAYEVH